MWDPYAEFQSAVLPNGLTVYSAYWPWRPWEAIGVLIYSGTEHDPAGLEGTAHFVEHLVSRNTIASREEMRDFFEHCGGKVSFGSTGHPSTYYCFFVQTDRTILTEAFSMFGNMLLLAKLEKDIERERKVVIGEFHRHFPLEVKYILEREESRALFGGCWLERCACSMGNPDTIGLITQSDLQSYYDTHYTPANMSIVGVGGIQLSELVALLSESPFIMAKDGTRTPLPVPTDNVAPPSETRKIIEMSKYVNSPMKTFAYRTIAKIPGSVNIQAIKILRDMLDKVLFDEIRELRAWSQRARSYNFNFRHFHALMINCEAVSLKAIDDFDAVIESCIASMADREELFNRVKHNVLANNSMNDQAGQEVRERVLNDLADYYRIVTLAEIGENTERVTMEDIRNIVLWLRPEQRRVMIVRP